MTLKHTFAKAIGYGNALRVMSWIKPLRPKEIIIDICAACNATCPFCPRLYMPAERSKGYMDLELFKFILQEAKREGVKNIRLYSTAEPTLHPEFDEIIDLLKAGGFHIAVSTNASRIDKHLDALLKVDILQFSIEGWDKESYEKYRIPLKFDHVYNNIVLFDAKRKEIEEAPKVSTNLLLTKHTDLEKYMALWGNFIDDIQVHFMLEATVYEDNKFVSKKNEKIEEEYFEFTRQDKDFVCGYPFNILTIAFDGKIALCCNDFSASMDMGNIKEGIDKVFHSMQLNAIRKEFYSQNLEKCAGCSFFHKPLPDDVLDIKSKIASLDAVLQNKIHTSF